MLGEAASTEAIDSLRVELQEKIDGHESWAPIIEPLFRILDGERNSSLADNAKLSYQDVAELRFLLDRLAAEGK